MYVPQDKIDKPLYVIAPVFNPIRYKSRWKHLDRFAEYIKFSGAILYIVEAKFGEREAVVGPGGEASIEQTRGPFDSEHITVHVRTDHELWLKENLINIGISRLPADADYIAWIDADVAFARPNWVGETIHQLQHYDFVQLFTRAVDVGPNYEPIQSHRGFVDSYDNGLPRRALGGYGDSDVDPYSYHPGFAWAARRRALDAVGGLVDFAILGAADNHMANALVGTVSYSYHKDVSQPYRDRLEQWQERAIRHVRKNVGTVSGLLVHYWHGKKRDRKYWDRWQILVNHQYNPFTDIKYDTQGILRLDDHGDERSIQLRDALRKYFRQRNEDSIDL